MSRLAPTLIGTIRALTGASVNIELRKDLQSTLTIVHGETHRIGQIGSFVRIPLGYTNLYAVVTQVGASAAPGNVILGPESSHRWLSAVLFGESVSGVFERGVSQFPTIGDEAHVLTTTDLETIYSSSSSSCSILVGTISSSSGIAAHLDLTRIVSRHTGIVGSTGSGKSNSVAVLLEAIAMQGFPSARVLVLDAHGEYGAVVAGSGHVYRLHPSAAHERPLYVPFWALPADEFIAIAMGKLPQAAESAVRDAIADLKRAAAVHLQTPPPQEAITADSPIPFSARRLWFELDDYERVTYKERQPWTLADKTVVGSAQALTSNVYPPPGPGTSQPFLGPRRGISRALELMRSRLQDARFSFLFSPGPDLSPDLDGRVRKDLDEVVANWIGHDRPITVIDISGLPSDAMAAIAGTVLRITYDALYWGRGTPIGGRSQPLLVVLEEAHRVIPSGIDSPSLRSTTQIAKEGRKHGVGLVVITQRPTELDQSVLSQCGTMITLRLSNHADRAVVASAMPDDLGNLAAMVPALRTGEALVVGEAVKIPTRIRFRLAGSRPLGDDPQLSTGWKNATRPDSNHYATAIANWRKQSE